MRQLLTGGALVALVHARSACGGSSSSSASEEELQRESDLYAISQIEKTFHEAITKKDIDEMMSLFAPNATATFGPGKTVSGTERIRGVWLESDAFDPKTNWLSDHPAYKLKATVTGDRGTLRFECHFVDLGTGTIAAVTGGNTDVARIDDRWLITNFVGSTAELKR
jgi:ketosteroid isomerase-like protein